MLLLRPENSKHFRHPRLRGDDSIGILLSGRSNMIKVSLQKAGVGYGLENSSSCSVEYRSCIDCGVVFAEFGLDYVWAFQYFFVGDGGLPHLDEISDNLNVDLNGNFTV